MGFGTLGPVSSQLVDYIADYMNGQTAGNEAFGGNEVAIPDTHDTGTPEALSAEPQPTLSQYFADNGDVDPVEAMRYMSQHSEEWAEKYLDYLVERGELDRSNAYTAEREDTAYQRLVQDLNKAGINPAFMFGSSASTSASGSQGYIRATEGATSRGTSNYSKIQKVLLSYMLYQLKAELGWANTAIKGVNAISNLVDIM